MKPMYKLCHKQFQSLSQCEAMAMAKETEENINRVADFSEEHGFKRGITEAYAIINKALAEAGWPVPFTFDFKEE